MKKTSMLDLNVEVLEKIRKKFLIHSQEAERSPQVEFSNKK